MLLPVMAALFWYGGASHAGIPVQPVAVSVVVQDATGAPIDGLYLTLFGDTGQYADGVTDATGLVNLAVERPTGHSTVVVSIVSVPLDPADRAGSAERESRRREVLRENRFQTRCRVVLEDGVNQYSLPITASQAVSVSGNTLVGGNTEPTDVLHPGAFLFARSDRYSGRFRLGGLGKDTTGQILVAVGDAQFRIVALSAEDLQSDIDLGDIDATSMPGDSALELDVVSIDIVDMRGWSQLPSVSLVRDDGAIIVCMYVDENGRASPSMLAPESLMIPAGSYYVAPGPAGANGLCEALIGLVLDGTVDLDAAGVPKLVVIAGQPLVAEVDAAAAAYAIETAGG